MRAGYCDAPCSVRSRCSCPPRALRVEFLVQVVRARFLACVAGRSTSAANPLDIVCSTFRTRRHMNMELTPRCAGRELRNLLFVCLLTACLGAVVTPESDTNGHEDYPVRLAGGTTPNVGRVEVYHNGTWNVVCDAAWDMSRAGVVCRELGYPGAIADSGKTVVGFGQAEGAALRAVSSVSCSGHEDRIADCVLGAQRSLHCLKPATVSCLTHGPSGELSISIQLEGGRTPLEGEVQIRLDDSWLPVCGDDWDLADARVVCKHLGYHFAKSATTAAREDQRRTAVARQRGMTESNRAQLDRSSPGALGWAGFRCTGHEDRLEDCRQVEGRRAGCGQGGVAQVVCSDMPSIPAGEHIRLSGHADDETNQGRVEVYFDGIWWKVCGEDWDMRHPRVVCRQLGYPSALTVYKLTGKPPATTASDCDDNTGALSDRGDDGDCDADYLRDELRCAGNESSLAECVRHYDGLGRQRCGMALDAAVVCNGKRVQPTFEARLEAGEPNRPYEGRVELRHDDRWWLVCHAGWDGLDAAVVCRQLGFPGVEEGPGGLPAYKAADRGAYLLADAQCDGTEANLAECPHGRVGRGGAACEETMAAGVRCATDSLIIQGEDIRLLGGDTVLEGRVELYHDHRWWTICDDNWDIKAAEVACRQLGLPSAESAVFGAYFGSGREAMGILLDEVTCKGSEGNLLECSHHVLGQHDCTHGQDAGVRCTPPTVQHQLKLPKPIRLAGGSNSSEGRVEIFHSFRWWRVCRSGNESDDMKAALIACRQLDFPDARAVAPADGFGAAPRHARVLLAGLRCEGTERNLTLCRRDDDDDGGATAAARGCDPSQDLAVRCTENGASHTGGAMTAQTRQRRSGPTTPVLAVIIATVFVTGFLIGSLLLYHVYKACDRFLSRHPAVISGDAVRSPSATANLDRPELAREARESARNKDMFIELYPLPPPPPDGDDTETEGGDDHEYSDWGDTPIRREPHTGPPPNTPDIAFDGTLV